MMLFKNTIYVDKQTSEKADMTRREAQNRILDHSSPDKIIPKKGLSYKNSGRFFSFFQIVYTGKPNFHSNLNIPIYMENQIFDSEERFSCSQKTRKFWEIF